VRTETEIDTIARALSKEDYRCLKEEVDTLASTLTGGGLPGKLLDIMGGGRTSQLLQEEFDENRQILAAYVRLQGVTE